MQAVIISFDSLAANSLGCYGNEWIETPNLDRLAADGIVFDQHYADTVGAQAGLSWATGEHTSLSQTAAQSTSFGKQLQAAGVKSTLITADSLNPWQATWDFTETQSIDCSSGLQRTPDQVPIARLVKAGIQSWQQVDGSSSSRLLWIHAPAPQAPPEGFDSLYFEDFEERGQSFEGLSPEQLADHPAVYAGSVSLIDHWIGELLSAVRAHERGSPTMIVVTAARGHRWHHIEQFGGTILSKERPPLCDQLMRTPLILNLSDDQHFAGNVSLRSNRLVQSSDFVATLLDWFGTASTQATSSQQSRSWLREITEEVAPRSQLIVSDDRANIALRTADWLCIQDHSTKPTAEVADSHPAGRVFLYAKPDDIWDVDDIASQQPDLVGQLIDLIPTIKPAS